MPEFREVSCIDPVVMWVVQGPVVEIWPGHRGYTPTLYEMSHGIFNDHRESGPQFNVSTEIL